MAQVKYFCPIILKNSRLKSFQISPDIELRKFVPTEREYFFGLKKVDFGFTTKFPLGFIGLNQFVASTKHKGRCPYSSLITRGMVDGTSDIIASNYLIIINMPEADRSVDIDRLNLLFKLLRATSTGIFLSFREGETGVGFHYPQAIHGPYDYLKLDSSDIKFLQNTYHLLQAGMDDRIKLCSELYARALIGDRSHLDVRFLLMVLALETLYLPKREQELGFRLRLYVAKSLGRSKDERMKIFEEVKNIYKVRSEIVHGGHAKKLTGEVFVGLTELVRKSINLYLSRKDIFADLEGTCLVG